MRKDTKIGVAVLVVVLAYLYNRNTPKKIPGLSVQTKSGTVAGITSLSRDGREFLAWLGIPFARPPLNELRFETPKPVKRWDGVLDASTPGSMCVQYDKFKGQHEGSEDCLFLNIYTPKARKSEELLPVLFWIHGGYFVKGSGDTYGPEYFMDESVVLVTINYRLGPWGFLNTGDDVVRGNMGLKDQSMALRWVSENIGAFGGDSNRITIFGESAGGASIHYHVLSPMSRGLFSKAIIMSGSAQNPWAFYHDPVGQAQDFAAKFGCRTSSTLEMAKCLKAFDIPTMINFLKDDLELLQLGRPQSAIFVPTMESVNDSEAFLCHHPDTLMLTGDFARVPLLIGGTSHEGLFFTQLLYVNASLRRDLPERWDYVDETFLNIPPEKRTNGREVREFYFGSDVKDFMPLDRIPTLTNMITDRMFFVGMHNTAVLHNLHAPTFFYFYEKRSSESIFNILVMLKGYFHPIIEIIIGSLARWFRSNVLGVELENFGTCHGDDLMQLFPVPFAGRINAGHADYEFSKNYVKLFVSFASEEDAPSFRGKRLDRVPLDGKLQAIKISDNPPVMSELPNTFRIQFWNSLRL